MKNIFNRLVGFMEKHKELIYLFALCLYVGCSILTRKIILIDYLSTFLKVLKYLSLVPILLKIVFLDVKYYSKEAKNIIVIVLLLNTICFFFTTYARTFLRYFILILGAYRIKINKALNYYLCSEIIVVLFIILLSILNIIPNNYYVRNGVIRYCLGFSWPTIPSIFLYCIMCIYLFLKGKNVNNYMYVFFLVMSIFMFLVTGTRFELICSVLAIVMSILYKYYSNNVFNSYVRKIAMFVMPFFTIISLLLAVNYNSANPIYSYLNKISSNRLLLSYNATKQYGIPLFGKNIDWVGQIDKKNGENAKESTVDNGYMNVIFNYGVVFLAMLEYGYYLVVKRNRKNQFLNYMIILLAIHSFVNPQLMQFSYNPFMIFLLISIFKNDKKGVLYD